VIKCQDLSIDKRLRLVENLWDDIAADNETLKLTPDQRAELDRRLDATRLVGTPDAARPRSSTTSAGRCDPAARVFSSAKYCSRLYEDMNRTAAA
jgi:putative addiction module component (TIGR02574 family)